MTDGKNDEDHADSNKKNGDEALNGARENEDHDIENEDTIPPSSALVLPRVMKDAETTIRGSVGDVRETAVMTDPAGIIDYVEKQEDWTKEALAARDFLQVEDVHDPEKPFFTPDVVRGFLDEPAHLENFDTYLTMELLVAVSNRLETEDNLVRFGSERTMVVGDIHGNRRALQWALDMFREREDLERAVFLGDYVDRGPDSLYVLNRLFLEKLADPDGIILLRGNHETLPVNYHYGFRDEVNERFLYRHSDKVYRWYNEIFSLMPLAALLGSGAAAMHGGIPRGVSSLAEFDDIPANTDLTLEDRLFEVLWNDPVDEDLDYVPSKRGERARSFGRKVFDAFLRASGISGMVVSHGHIQDGYQYYFDDRLLRIFSCPDYMGMGNAGTVAVVSERGELNVVEMFGSG